MITRFFKRYEMIEEKEGGQATKRSHSRAAARFRGAGIVLALISLLTFVTSPPLSQAAFPGPNGQIAFTSTRDGRAEVYVMNPDGTNQTRLTNAPIGSGKASWSADGAKIAFQSYRDDDPEIYVMNADGSNQTRLTNVAGADDNPHWSPDGMQIVFDSDRGGQPDVFIMNADGTNQTNLTNNPSTDSQPAWSPDGTKIAFQSTRDGNFEIYVMSADGTSQTRLTNNPADDNQPRWSPDGTKITFESTRDGNQEVYVMNADGTNQTRLTNNPSFDVQAAWSPDGAKIAFMSGRDGNAEIYVMDADGSSQVNITNTATNETDPNWQPAITLAVDVNADEVYPGDVTTVDLNVLWAQDLYGLQTECAVDPAILDTQSGAFGPFFDTPLVGINSADSGAGTWFGGVSQQSPGAPLSGNGLYATMTYQALSPGTSGITCEGLAADIDGFELPLVINDSSLTVLAFGSITGTVTYQGHLDHANIDVVATGPVTNSGTTGSAGDFEIDQLKSGSYDVEANAPLYLPSCITTPVDNGQVTALAATTLRGGDANNDEQLSIGDATLIGANFGLEVPPGDPAADINADARVNVQDLSILGGNFGLDGCQAW